MWDVLLPTTDDCEAASNRDQIRKYLFLRIEYESRWQNHISIWGSATDHPGALGCISLPIWKDSQRFLWWYDGGIVFRDNVRSKCLHLNAQVSGCCGLLNYHLPAQRRPMRFWPLVAQISLRTILVNSVPPVMYMPTIGIHVVNPTVGSAFQTPFPEKPSPPLMWLRRRKRGNGRSLAASKGSFWQRELVLLKSPRLKTRTATSSKRDSPIIYSDTLCKQQLKYEKKEKLEQLKGLLKVKQNKPGRLLRQSSSFLSSLSPKQLAMTPPQWWKQ